MQDGHQDAKALRKTRWPLIVSAENPGIGAPAASTSPGTGGSSKKSARSGLNNLLDRSKCRQTRPEPAASPPTPTRAAAPSKVARRLGSTENVSLMPKPPENSLRQKD